MSAATPPGARHWPDVARRWARVGSPLRPSPEDLRLLSEGLESALSQPQVRVLILGVTPEFHRLPWPTGADVFAVDHTPAMIEAVWPGSSAQVACAEWTRMPLDPASRDVALLDGGLHLLDYPRGQRLVVSELRRILVPGGRCLIRLFLPTREPPTLDSVIADVLAGRIGNVNFLKFRLWNALHRNAEVGLELDAVWSALKDIAPDLSSLAERLGWPLEELETIETYRGSKVRYHFLSFDEALGLFCNDPGGFELESTKAPGYAFGECFPTVVLRRKAE